MLRRSWLPLCLWLVLGTSVVSLLAAPARHRSDFPATDRIKHATITLSPGPQTTYTTEFSVQGSSLGAQSGGRWNEGMPGVTATSARHPRQASGWSLGGIKEWWLGKVTDARQWLAQWAHHTHRYTGRSDKTSPDNTTGDSVSSDYANGTGGGVGVWRGLKARSARHSGSGSGRGSGTGDPPPSGTGGGSGTGDPPPSGTGGGSGTGDPPPSGTGSGSGTGDPPPSGTGGGSGSGSGGGTSGGSGGGSAGDPPPSGETRDPADWPFAATSPWNYPIGSNARYTDFTVVGHRRPAAGTGMKLGMDANTSVTWVGQPSDPMRTWSYGSTAIQMRIPDNAGGAGGEQLATFIDVSHLYAQDSYGSSRDGNGNWSAGGALVNVLLKGSGHGFDGFACLGPNQFPDTNWCLGQTRAAGVPLFAGAVRPGELTNGIRHALALIVGREFLRRSPGYVWPAEADDGSDGYTGGPACNYSLGQLVAIPWSVDVERLPLRLPQSRNIARALQRYGAYSVDTSDGLFDVSIDGKAYTEWYSWITDPNWANDMYEVIGAQLRIVTNGFNPTNGRAPRNGVKLDGGDGSLSVPLAPPFDR